ncbi:K+/H+ antiporter subunit F [Xylophilus rhododendri]|uniref:K+/H+ antiporter subunit F n=1 Tax=Xylophilus rhododendri TaxID=2697032 RepID=A0A857JAD1_9BURK|nr:K+/H+ antiporter subunit F [Xylophilus rhododendri]QHI99942.1 K+/H+ antiporter subunit F [Xylophilus rhododendri]
MNSVLACALWLGPLMLLLAMACALLRLLLGPLAEDRILALDALYTASVLLVLVLGLRANGGGAYFEVALLIALLGFASSSAMAKFVLRGEVVE